ncbi:hypothetical protein niasHT_000985 [Heterodera trifolii]|uniref:Uncharacterized protein n=1 Tax=Heterodera trifolii TaxID=157864 RepID=A0ABD2LUI7_9BILA
MGVARDFGPWGLNAREFRRAGLNPRVWLARRVNQSATDGMGGVAIFCVNVADPSPLFRRPGGADPLSSTDPLPPSARTPSLRRRGPPPSVGTDPLSLLRRGPLPTILSSVGADLLSPLPRPPPHHSVVRAVRTPSLPRTLSLLPRPPPYHSVVRAARTPPLFHGPPLPTAPRPPPHHSVVRAARTPSGHRRGPRVREFCCRENSAQNSARGEILLRRSAWGRWDECL